MRDYIAICLYNCYTEKHAVHFNYSLSIHDMGGYSKNIIRKSFFFSLLFFFFFFLYLLLTTYFSSPVLLRSSVKFRLRRNLKKIAAVMVLSLTCHLFFQQCAIENERHEMEKREIDQAINISLKHTYHNINYFIVFLFY